MKELLALILIAQNGADLDFEERARAVAAAETLPAPERTRILASLLGDPHLRVRSRARGALRKTRDSEAVDLLVRRILRDPRPLFREGACEVLEGADSPAAVEALTDRLADGDPGVRAAAAAALGNSHDPAPCDPLIASFRRERHGLPGAALLEAVAKLDPSRMATLLPQAADHPQYEVRLVAAGLSASAAPDLLGKLTADRDWRVRSTAMEACLKARRPPCVEWLIERLAHEEGRLQREAWAALENLTDRDLGPEAGPWKRWWEANRETFLPPPEAKDGGVATAGTRAGFFGSPIFSTRIVFVLDLSGSMRDPAPQGRPTKLDAAKEGMIATIRSLPPGTRFGIAGLGCDARGNDTMRERKTWGGRLRLFPASPAAKGDAERFVTRLEAKGWTNLYDGIAHAFEDPDVDTIYLYTDGGASKGTFVAAREILDHLRRMNRFRRIVLHAVEVPGERNPMDNRRLLMNLAQATGGTFVGPAGP